MSSAAGPGDHAANAILDFQSVMTQWLDLQASMFDVYARRRVGSPSVVSSALPGTAGLSTAGRHLPVEAGSVADHPAIASRYTVSAQPCPRTGLLASLAPDHVVLITDDGRGVASCVAERLRGQGLRAAIVTALAGSDPRLDVFPSPLDSIAEAERVTQAIQASCGPVAAVIHLAPLAPSPPFETLDDASWWSHLARETRALFLLVRAVGASLQRAAGEGGAACIAVTSMGGVFGADRGGTSRPSHGGVTGFLKCVAIEYPDVRVRTMDVADGPHVATLADLVLDELWADETHTEIGYANGQRLTLGVEPAPVTMDAAFDLPSDGVILATGGARGITADVCIELAERYQPTFVLVGQSPLPSPHEAPDTAGLQTPVDLKRALTQRLQTGGSRVTPAVVEQVYKALLREREIRETISRLSAAGARTHYVQLDVQNEQAFGALIDEVYAAYGRIDGVIHGAGIIEDKLVRDKSLESFDRVFRTKVLSAFTLSRRLRSESLRFLVFFTSVAGRFGNRGQADYAAANEVVSKLAVALQRTWPGRVCAIAWAPWNKRGMVSEELEREFARRGVSLLSPRAGRRALWLEIQQRGQAPAEVVVAGAGSPSLAGAHAPEACPLLMRSTRTTTSDGVRFDVRVDPSHDLYLNDHRLNGRPVLPLAFATEMMAEAAQLAWPDRRVVGVRDLQMLKGIVVEGPAQPLVVTVRKSRQSADGTLSEVDAEITTPSTAPELRYRAVVEQMAGDLAAPTFDTPHWPVSPMTQSLEQVYHEWAFHGPLFRRVTGIDGIGVRGIRGTVYSPSSSAGLQHVQRAAWILDPYVFDALLQLFLFWSRDQHDKTALPARFRSFRRYAPLSDQRLTCYLEAESLTGGHALRGSAHLLDTAGRVCAVLEGMEASCSRALNRLVTTGVER